MLGTGFRRFIATLLTVAAALVPSIAHSQVRYSIDLPAQSLEDSLKAIARITGTNVLFEPQLVRGKSGGAVKGNLTIEEAVGQALRGTSLEARRSTDNTLILREKADERAPQKTSGASADDTGIQRLDSIRVTAQKRDERLVDVPQSVAVVTAQDIDRRHLVSAEDYLRGIPGVNQVGQGGLGTAIQIRGIETAPYPYFQNFTSGPSVATYFGETPTTNSAGLAGGSNIDLKVVDVERVEVLRGPQGTAFGSSAMGGAVRTIPVAPKLSSFEGSATASYSSTSGTGGDNYSGQAVLNVPLVADKLAVRGVAYHYQDSGYYRNIARSDPAFLAAVTAQGAGAFAQDQEEVGSVRFDGGRIAANYRASDTVKFLFTYVKQRTRLDGQANSTKAGYEQAVLQVAPEHVVRGRPEGVFDTDVDLLSATADIDLGLGSLLATYSRVQSDARYSSPRTAQAGNQPYSQLGKSDHNADSGEIRFVSRLDGPWNFLAGLYGENLEDAASFNFVWYGSLASLPPGFGTARFLGEQRDTRKQRQNAAFGEVSWEFVPKLTLTLGARYYDYKRTGRLENEGGPFIGGNTSTTTEVNEDGSRYRANLSYKPDDNSIAYVSFAQGFRLGKPQVPLQPGACDTNGDGILDGTGGTPLASTGLLQSDEVDSYELGGRLSTLGQRVFLSGAIYRMDWSGIPFRVRAPLRPDGCGLVYITNAGKARSEGLELQASVYITKSLRADLGGSLTDAKLTEAVPAQNIPSGTRLPGTPRRNANAGLQYEFVLAGYKSFVRADAIYLSDFHTNLPETPANRVSSYTKIDASARMTIRNVNVDLYVQNLTDEDNASPGNLYAYHLRPRTVGFQVGYNF